MHGRKKWTQKGQKSRLKPQSKLPSFPFLTNLIQEPRNGLLLRQPGTIKMLAHGQGQLILAHPVLANDAMWQAVILVLLPIISNVMFSVVVVVVRGGFLHSRGRSGGSGSGVFVVGLVGSLDGDGCWRTKTDSLGEEDVRITF